MEADRVVWHLPITLHWPFSLNNYMYYLDLLTHGYSDTFRCAQLCHAMGRDNTSGNVLDPQVPIRSISKVELVAITDES